MQPIIYSETAKELATSPAITMSVPRKLQNFSVSPQYQGMLALAKSRGP